MHGSQLLVIRFQPGVVLDVYRATASFPRAELDGLTSQLRRSAVSLPSHVAEGCCRSQGDFGRFIQIAAGSARELEYQLLLAKDLGSLQVETCQAISNKSIVVKRMLAGLLARLRADG